MNAYVSGLAGLKYELAMALGSSLDLEAMLDLALETLLRQLGARAAAVYARGDGEGLRLVHAIPSGGLAPLQIDPRSLGLDPDAARAAHQVRPLVDDIDRYVFGLPGFGLLIVDRRGPRLEPAVLRALEPVMERFGRAARACADHAQVRFSEARFAALVNTLPQVIVDFRLSEDGAIAFDYVSPRLDVVLGVSSDALRARPGLLGERIGEKERELLQAALRAAALRPAPFEHVARVRDAGGEVRYLLLAASPRGVDGDDRWSGYLQDITVRERLAEAERETSRLRLASLISSVGDAVVGADADGTITYWNHGAERLLGHAADAVIGQPAARVLPSSGWLTSGELAGGGAPAELGRPVEITVRHAAGHEVPVELVLNHAKDGGRVYVVGVLRDLTDRRRSEQERLRSVEQERRFTTALIEIGRLSGEELPALAPRASAVVAQALGVARVSIWELTARSIVCLDLYEALEARHTSGIELREDDFASYFEALRSDVSIVAPDARTHPATACFRESYLEPLGIVSMLDVPLRSPDGTRGVLCVEAFERRDWRPEEVRFCAEVSGIVGQVMERGVRARVEAQHRIVLASIGEAVVACDVAGRVTLLNPVGETLTGWSLDEARGRPIDEVVRIVPPGAAEPVGYPGAAAGASGDEVVLLARRDGEHVPVAVVAAPIVEHGAVIGSVVTLRDVRAEQRSRRALEEQNARLRAVGEAIPDLLLAVSLDGRVSFEQVGARAEWAHVFPAADGDSLAHLFPPEVAARLLGTVADVVRTGRVRTVLYQIDEDDGAAWFEARLAPMSEEQATVLVRNITLERAREDSLRLERERLAMVLAGSSAVLYTARLPDFTIEYMSDSAREVLGFPLERFQQPGFWSWAIHPDDRERVLASVSELYATGRRTNEYRHRHADGGYRWLRDQVQVFYDSAGTPVRAVGASIDITERKLGEARLEALLDVQEIVAWVSAAFLEVGRGDAHDIVSEALGRLGRQTGSDRAYLVENDAQGFYGITHEWCAEGVTSHLGEQRRVPARGLSFFLDPIRRGAPLHVGSVAALPAEAQAEREWLAAQGIESLLLVPLLLDGELHGFLGIGNPRLDSFHPSEFASLMQLLADAVAAGLQRVEDERKLRALNDRLTATSDRQRALLELSLSFARAGSRRELLDMTEGRRLLEVLGCDRASLVERIADGARYRVRLLDAGSAASDCGASGPSVPGRMEIEVDAATIADRSVGAAFASGEVVWTGARRRTDFPDWVDLHDCHGHQQFVVLPLLGSVGMFAALHLSFLRSEPLGREDMDWFAQFGSLLAAHLSIHDARAAIEGLNADLERRVEERTRALRASEDRFERLFEHAPQAMIIVDASRRIVQSNRNATRLFRLPAPALAEMSIRQLVPEPVRERHDHLMKQYDEGGEGRAMAVGRVVHALRGDGSTFSAEIGLVPIDLDGGQHVLAGVTDITDRLAAEAAVARSLREKETLLKEIHHRVKNNLQIISSLLMLQRDQMPSEAAQRLLEESVLRVRSMALIHQQLYGVDSLERIELGEYARSLASSLQGALAPRVRIQVASTGVEVSVETAVPLGLILNELLTNAIKYGVPERAEAPAGARAADAPPYDVLVEIARVEDSVRVAVTDFGPGLPEGFDPARATSLGLHLVRTLNRQLRGALDVRVDGGTRFSLVCPLPVER